MYTLQVHQPPLVQILFFSLLFMFSKSRITHYKIISSEYIVGDIGEKLDGMYTFMNRFGKWNSELPFPSSFLFQVNEILHPIITFIQVSLHRYSKLI